MCVFSSFLFFLSISYWLRRSFTLYCTHNIFSILFPVKLCVLAKLVPSYPRIVLSLCVAVVVVESIKYSCACNEAGWLLTSLKWWVMPE